MSNERVSVVTASALVRTAAFGGHVVRRTVQSSSGDLQQPFQSADVLVRKRWISVKNAFDLCEISEILGPFLPPANVDASIQAQFRNHRLPGIGEVHNAFAVYSEVLRQPLVRIENADLFV